MEVGPILGSLRDVYAMDEKGTLKLRPHFAGVLDVRDSKCDGTINFPFSLRSLNLKDLEKPGCDRWCELPPRKFKLFIILDDAESDDSDSVPLLTRLFFPSSVASESGSNKLNEQSLKSWDVRFIHHSQAVKEAEEMGLDLSKSMNEEWLLWRPNPALERDIDRIQSEANRAEKVDSLELLAKSLGAVESENLPYESPKRRRLLQAKEKQCKQLIGNEDIADVLSGIIVDKLDVANPQQASESPFNQQMLVRTLQARRCLTSKDLRLSSAQLTLSESTPASTVSPVSDSPRIAIDLGCGSGRDAVWLARRGWSVLGLDCEGRAVTRARSLANRYGVEERCKFLCLKLEQLLYVQSVTCEDTQLSLMLEGPERGWFPTSSESATNIKSHTHRRNRLTKEQWNILRKFVGRADLVVVSRTIVPTQYPGKVSKGLPENALQSLSETVSQLASITNPRSFLAQFNLKIERAAADSDYEETPILTLRAELVDKLLRPGGLLSYHHFTDEDPKFSSNPNLKKNAIVSGTKSKEGEALVGELERTFGGSDSKNSVLSSTWTVLHNEDIDDEGRILTGFLAKKLI